MKNERILEVLIFQEDKIGSETLKKVLNSNEKVNKIDALLVNDLDELFVEIKCRSTKSYLILLGEPTYSKVAHLSLLPYHINLIKQLSPKSEVIVLTSFTKTENLLAIFRSGAFDVIVKDQNMSTHLMNSIRRYFEKEEQHNKSPFQLNFIASSDNY